MVISGIQVDEINISKQVEDNSKYQIINESCIAEEPRDVEVEACIEDNPSITIVKDYWPTVIPEGEYVRIKATITGLTNCEIFIVWYYTDDNVNWVEMITIQF